MTTDISGYIITFKKNISTADAKQFLVDNDLMVTQFIDRVNVAFVTMTADQYSIIKNSTWVEAVDVNEERVVLPPKSIDQPMDLSRIKKELYKRHNTDEDGYGQTGISLLKYENIGFKVGDYTFGYEEDFGGEGKGDDYWVVFSVAKDGETTRYYKVPGWYASHHGGELEVDNTYEVTPTTKTINVWTEVK